MTIQQYGTLIRCNISACWGIKLVTFGMRGQRYKRSMTSAQMIMNQYIITLIHMRIKTTVQFFHLTFIHLYIIVYKCIRNNIENKQHQIHVLWDLTALHDLQEMQGKILMVQYHKDVPAMLGHSRYVLMVRDHQYDDLCRTCKSYKDNILTLRTQIKYHLMIIIFFISKYVLAPLEKILLRVQKIFLKRKTSI